MIEYHNPDAPVGVEDSPYDLAVAIGAEDATSIGLLANGFPDSVEFLAALGESLKALRPGIAIHAYNKGNASIPAGQTLLGEIGGECVGVVAAYGH